MALVVTSDSKTYGDAIASLNAYMSLLEQAMSFPNLTAEQTDNLQIATASVSGLTAMFLGRPVTDEMTEDDKDHLLRSTKAAEQAYVGAGGKVPGINTSLDPYVNTITNAVNSLPIPKFGLPSVSWLIVVVFFVFVIGGAALYYFTNRRVIA